MNPLWFIAKLGGIALITTAGAILLMKKLAPPPSNLIAGALHFKKGMDEFQKGLQTMMFGPPGAAGPEAARERKESGRIRID
ncbi:MAG: hypothetical protein FJY85_07690 [Deltaproteobacteria bacterium]|nr:hypothetical protein [Deltaproteobacteria bacterium]